MEAEVAPRVNLVALPPGLFAAPLDLAAVSGLADGVSDLNSLEAQVVARRAEYLAEIDRRKFAQAQGYSSTPAWLVALSGDPGAVCCSRVAMAEALEEMPETRKAFAADAISESRVKLLAQAQAQALAPEQFAADEAALVAQMKAASARQVPQVLAE